MARAAYVVLNAATQPGLYVIQSPGNTLQAQERAEVRYVVRVEEITRVAPVPPPPAA